MSIEALALLQITSLDPKVGARVDQLDDAVIVHTGLSFAAEPEALAAALAAQIGVDTLARHRDARGILFLPDVAAPTGRTYAAVVAQVGEGGVWAPFSARAPEALLAQGGDFGALLGNVLAQLPPSLLSAASSAAEGNRQALDAVSAQVQALLGNSPALQTLAGQLSGMLGANGPAAGVPGSEQPADAQLSALDQMFASFGGGEAARSSLHALAGQMQAELEKDPAKFEQLAQRLLGGDEPDDEDPK